MAEKTGIAWCDHSFNPWIGCTKVSPGCDHCYAEALDRRHRWKGAEHWGPGVPRMRTGESNWKEPLKWDRKAAAAGARRLVFCASLADVFDNEVPTEWRADLFELIRATRNLTWLLLTKRIGNVPKMMSHYFDCPNVWLGASIVNQEEADRDLPKLLSIDYVAKRFVSYEPALAEVNFRALDVGHGIRLDALQGVHSGPAEAMLERKPPNYHQMRSTVDWLIVGGESAQGGAKARPFRRSWASSAVKQCRHARIPVFVKQMGSYVIDRNDAGFDGCDLGSWPLAPDGSDPTVENDIHGYREENQGADCRVRLRDRAGADPAEWPLELQAQEFPT